MEDPGKGERAPPFPVTDWTLEVTLELFQILFWMGGILNVPEQLLHFAGCAEM